MNNSTIIHYFRLLVPLVNIQKDQYALKLWCVYCMYAQPQQRCTASISLLGKLALTLLCRRPLYVNSLPLWLSPPMVTHRLHSLAFLTQKGRYFTFQEGKEKNQLPNESTTTSWFIVDITFEHKHFREGSVGGVQVRSRFNSIANGLLDQVKKPVVSIKWAPFYWNCITFPT